MLPSPPEPRAGFVLLELRTCSRRLQGLLSGANKDLCKLCFHPHPRILFPAQTPGPHKGPHVQLERPRDFLWSLAFNNLLGWASGLERYSRKPVNEAV